jgi:hypothetical protein
MKKASTRLLTAAVLLCASFVVKAQPWTSNPTNVFLVPADLCKNTSVGTTTPPASVQFLSNACAGKAFGIVGQNTLSITTLSCGVEGFTNNPSTTNTSDGIGTWGYTEYAGLGKAFGARGFAKSSNSTGGTAYGVYGEGYINNCAPIDSGAGALPPTRVAIGVYGYASGLPPMLCPPTGRIWALYGDGNTFTTGTYTASDARLKSQVRNVSGALSLLGQLQAKTYEFRRDGRYQFSALPQGRQIGFLAQDIEKVLPELVTDAPLYIHDQKDGRTAPNSETIKAVNYTGLIPVLTQAVNELKAEVDGLRAELAALKRKGSEGIQPVTGQLLQNSPNPFSQSTVIRYQLASSVQQAILLIFDMQGKQVKQVVLNGRSNGSYTLQANELQAGMYIYTLVADGKEIESLRMILTKE